jgi:hypothetical protein
MWKRVQVGTMAAGSICEQIKCAAQAGRSNENRYRRGTKSVSAGHAGG